MSRFTPPPAGSHQRVKLKQQFPSLALTGVAAEFFPRYRNPKRIRFEHDVVYLSFVMRGRCEHVLQETRYPERPGSVSVVHYGQSHYFDTIHGAIDVMNLYIDPVNHPLPRLPDPLNELLPGLVSLHRNLGHHLNRVVRFEQENVQHSLRVLQALHEELSCRRTGWEEASRDLFRVFLIECVRSLLRKRPPYVPGRDVSFPAEKIRQCLEKDVTRSWSLSELASMAGLKRQSLCRSFKRHTGQTVFNYLLQRRIQKAMYLLRSTEDKVLSIAGDCGFRDVAYFNTQFRRFVGHPPRAYRQLKHQDMRRVDSGRIKKE
ncbi:MAG: AraC family transcriptional regulator [Verrucomicrobiae bacterium]|nr:AraC family transcriptional regulator [Verrucomicrobiae bacterium]